MENLQQNDYELKVLKNYGKFLHFENNLNLTLRLYNICTDWLITLKNGYLIKTEHYFSFAFKYNNLQQVKACIYTIYSHGVYSLMGSPT